MNERLGLFIGRLGFSRGIGKDISAAYKDSCFEGTCGENLIDVRNDSFICLDENYALT